ncbi:FAD:protein FMN transferase [Viridibacillus soli]|nr:FAD:protein FMN transferase [Viridibacillus soli]
MDRLSLHLMNTDFYIAVPENNQLNWKVKVENWLQYIAKEWSRFEENNELSKLNLLKVGDTMTLSSALYDCLQKANEYSLLSNGLFSPYLKCQIEQHGYNQSFPFTNTEEEPLQIDAISRYPFEFLNNQKVMKTANQEVDLGGFAKGYAVEKVAEWLQHQGALEYGIVDGGGDMQMWSDGEKEWTISIAHPIDVASDISYVKMKTGAIATSNRLFRSWTQANTKKHHLLDGRTGEIAKTDVLQATVITNSLCEAEVGAKLCFLLSEEEQQKWFEKNYQQCARFIVKEDSKGYWCKSRGKIKDVQ